MCFVCSMTQQGVCRGRAGGWRWMLLLGAVMALVGAVGGSSGTEGARVAVMRNIALRGGKPEAKKKLAPVSKFDENMRALDIVMRDRLSKKAAPTTEIEKTVANSMWRACKDNDELRMLKYLHVHEVREVVSGEKGGGRSLILMVPHAELKEYHELQERTGHRLQKQKRPRSRTLQAVHDAYLEDILFPFLIVSQHQVFQVNQAKPLHRIFLDPGVRDETEAKLSVFADVYRSLTGKRTEMDYLIYNHGTELEIQPPPPPLQADDAGFLDMPDNALTDGMEVPPASLLKPTGRGTASGQIWHREEVPAPMEDTPVKDHHNNGYNNRYTPR
ncbi:ribosomal protein S7e-domain-containing protein [Baffinella frigidus]|nr:ribosomal protein S7e-domain-containing protein [Cryptophyta sp. CCMP2293]